MSKVKQTDSERRLLLVGALQAEPRRRFRASELKQLTGVSKSGVRALLTAVEGVTIVRDHDAWWFSASSFTPHELQRTSAAQATETRR